MLKVESNSKKQETIGSNLQPFTSATARKSPLVEASFAESLSEECQSLNNLLSTMDDSEPIVVQLEACLFHYKEDRRLDVNKEDIAQMLQGKELDIPIMQVFMRFVIQINKIE